MSDRPRGSSARANGRAGRMAPRGFLGSIGNFLRPSGAVRGFLRSCIPQRFQPGPWFDKAVLGFGAVSLGWGWYWAYVTIAVPAMNPDAHRNKAGAGGSAATEEYVVVRDPESGRAVDYQLREIHLAKQRIAARSKRLQDGEV